MERQVHSTAKETGALSKGHLRGRGGAVRASAYGAAAVFLVAAASASAQWPQWGGPNQNCIVETSGLADKWPGEGPKRLWHRALGEGCSSIAVDSGVLYTKYRDPARNEYEYTIALDAGSGKTIWEAKNRAPLPPSPSKSERDYPGPNVTPLIVQERLYTIGRNAMIICYQKTDGTVLWKHDLPAEFGAQIPQWGYSSSPMAYGQRVIVPVGRTENDRREGGSLMAFEQSTGSVAWRSQTFRMGHSSPILISFEADVHLFAMDPECM